MTDNLIWIDLEMTGLNPEHDVILEIATLVTDAKLNIIAEGPNLAIHQTESVLQNMNEWCITHHEQSGLSQRVRESKISCEQAELQTLEFLKPYCQPGVSPLCGNSIGQDRRFIYKYMKQLSDFLHYRNIDVSTLKELAKRWYPELPEFEKSDTHLALADIRESISELKYFKENLFLKNS